MANEPEEIDIYAMNASAVEQLRTQATPELQQQPVSQTTQTPQPTTQPPPAPRNVRVHISILVEFTELKLTTRKRKWWEFWKPVSKLRVVEEHNRTRMIDTDWQTTDDQLAALKSMRSVVEALIVSTLTKFPCPHRANIRISKLSARVYE